MDDFTEDPWAVIDAAADSEASAVLAQDELRRLGLDQAAADEYVEIPAGLL